MKKSMRLRRGLSVIGTFVSLFTWTACIPEEGPFRFETSTLESFEAHVTLDGEPLRFAHVIVTDALIPDTEGKWMDEPGGGSVYFRGTTDAEGRVNADIRIPTRVHAVDLLVDRADATGPYTFERLREYWGPFAPSSRVTTGRNFLRGMQIELESS